MEYKYYLILKKDRSFVVLAVPSEVDVNLVLLRYNAPDYIELDVHTYFSYIYRYYGSVEQYWKKPGRKVQNDKKIA